MGRADPADRVAREDLVGPADRVGLRAPVDPERPAGTRHVI